MPNDKFDHRQIRFLCDQSLFWFIRIVGGYIDDEHNVISTIIHKPHCDRAQDPAVKRKGHGMPRVWGKTTNLTKWKAIWKYLQNPEQRQLLASEKEQLAINMLQWIQKQLLLNVRLRKIYWDKLHEIDSNWIRSHRWSSTQCDLPRNGIYSEPSITTIGIGGAAQSGHYDTIYIDDIIGRAALDSLLVMENALRWFDNVPELLVEPDATKPIGSEINLIGSPWGPGDIYDYVKAKYPEYQWMITPALKDGELKNDKTTTWIQNPEVDIGESNWPQRFATQVYLEMMANPEKELIFWSQHQCNPSKASGLNKFELSWLKYFRWDDRDKDGLWLVCQEPDEDGILKDGEAWPLAAIPLYGFIDPGGFAATTTKKGSRNAIVIGGQPGDTTKKFVTYTWAGKFKKPSMFLEEVFKAHQLQRPRHWRIDTVGTQPYIFQDILEERGKSAGKSEIIKKYPSGKNLSISSIKKEVGKDAKDSDIQALIMPISNGEIYVHRTMLDLKNEVKQYPHGLTRDLLDMLAQLNKEYWSRKPLEDSYRGRPRSSDSKRSSVSGY